ncbi:putative enoyl-CoA hydratase echA8 [Pseudovibrio axinellae]|uniref:3-hydroxyisobutyryl-CoA hydrolase n=1 Tax=Pseudovibrio axinellae TaxID=989403 RepID=A0A165WPC3_9HYPH|nr:enoyl-CoA hydratase/isomerase family protein [Pseudovibrio axinellae]KZL16757.1 putative enoyl-CoA hydratase echA8 [Pseudovibrio axinellae]SEQ75888.1 enoyl-CoA hydratase [Pseudovibrio axinellae]
MEVTDVLFEEKGHAGLIILNRPKALNALTHEIVVAMHRQLEHWLDNDRVKHILIKSNSEKAFCAGGDIRQVAENGPDKIDESLPFFADEYRLNAYMESYPKPLIALIDGIVMGGGVGISVHGAYRVGSEKTLFAMPETAIGFFPDVGGSHFLPKLAKHTGMYCAMTGERLKQADCYSAGILTHAVHSKDMAGLEEALCATEDVNPVLARYAFDPGPAPLDAKADVVDACFGAQSTLEVIDRLQKLLGTEHDEFASGALETIKKRSPLSMEVAFQQVRRGAGLSMKECMVMEHRIVSQILLGKDFYEGVRAVIIDKDHTPNWQHSSLSEIKTVDVEAHFMPPKGGDLVF